MKKGKLKEEKDRIAGDILEKGLIKKCQDVALLGKLVHRKQSDHKTHTIWVYGSKESFAIIYESGIYAMGDGSKINVYSFKEEVFDVRDRSAWDKKSPHILVGENYVLKYVPGDWEKEVETLLEKVPQLEVDLIKRNFPSLEEK